jgi:hypothetical protein
MSGSPGERTHFGDRNKNSIYIKRLMQVWCGGLLRR